MAVKAVSKPRERQRSPKGALKQDFTEKNREIGRMKDAGKLSEAEAKILRRSYQRQIDIMEERVHPSRTSSILKACEALQNDILGPITQKVSATLTLEAAVLGAIHHNERLTDVSRQESVNLLEMKPCNLLTEKEDESGDN